MTDRLKLLKKRLNLSKTESFLVSNPINIFYLAGYGDLSDEKDFWLLITSKTNYLLTDPRYSSSVKPSLDFRLLEITKDRILAQAIKKVLQDLKIQTLGFEDKGLSFFEFRKFKEALKPAELKPFGDPIESLRQIKNKEEVVKIQKAAGIADLAFNHILGFIKPGLTEEDIALMLEIFMRKSGADGISFPPVVAFGKNSAIPHHQTGKTLIQSPGILLLDFGARFQGYCSDLTRTIFLGKPPGELQKRYELVLAAQNKVLVQVKAGMKAYEADGIVRRVFRENGCEEKFLHSSGHGVGLSVHEGFALSPQNQTILQKGMVFTVEPGLYFPDWGGIRIEDLVLTGKDGVKRLSQSPVEMIVLS